MMRRGNPDSALSSIYSIWIALKNIFLKATKPGKSLCIKSEYNKDKNVEYIKISKNYLVGPMLENILSCNTLVFLKTKILIKY